MTSVESTTESIQTITEPMLLARATHSEAAALDELYRRHAAGAWRMAYAVACDRDVAQQSVVEAFARVFRTLRDGTYDAGVPFRPMILRAARNAARDHAADPVPALGARRSDDVRVLGAAFSAMPERSRAALWLTDAERATPRLAARILELDSGTTERLVERGRAALQSHYLKGRVATSNPNCARTVRRLGAYLGEALAESDAAKVDAHLTACEACHSIVDDATALDARLRRLIPAVPRNLGDEARAAWIADLAATEAPRPTATGLSATTEKVLAGVSAAAAVIGVVSAAFFGLTGGDADQDTAAPAPFEDAIVVTPAGDSGEVALGTDVGGPTVNGGSTSTGGRRIPLRTAAPSGTSGGDVITTTPRGTEAPAQSSNPTTRRPVSRSGSGGSGSSGGSGPIASQPEPGPTVPLPDQGGVTDPVVEVTAGTTVGGQPVAVSVAPGGDAGATVGPVTVGSAPTPPAGSPVQVGGSITDPSSDATPATPSVEQVLAPVTGTEL